MDGESKPVDYSRVTDPGRYAVLHDEADRLLDELTERYTVERRESRERLGPTAEAVRMVRLIPRTPAAAPLAIAFTAFPGVVLRLGRWYEETFPGCGCDACDEAPADLVTELHTQAGALVEGGLWERIRRGVTGSWAETRLIGPDFNAGRSMPVEAREARAARRDGFAAPVQWAPWPRRAV
uniref:Uncharacterized protein n=1 Tax=uncultured bacterium BAC AB649/1850 TaxID=1037453 RepID=F6K0Z9_9BACT|nr:conserved hypothetical protein [uncultured bacterium BAC AB649/1850]